MNTLRDRSNWSEYRDAWGSVFRNLAIVLVMTIGMVAGFHASAFAQAAKPKPTICAATIDKCGCEVTKKGLYKVTADLKSTDGLTPDGDCNEVASSNVILNLGNHSLTGPGGSSTDTGIDVKHLANNDTVLVSVAFATITCWETGVYTGGNNGTFSNLDTDSNDKTGIEFDGASSNRLTDWDASHEGTFGLWIRKGGNNFITQGHADSNRDGIFVGCGDAVGGEDCKGAGIDKANDLVDNETGSNSRYGLALDSNAAQTVVNATSASGNTSDDLFDGSASCGTDTWLDNDFSTSNDVGCIE
jgi:hypothetical protein